MVMVDEKPVILRSVVVKKKKKKKQTEEGEADSEDEEGDGEDEVDEDGHVIWTEVNSNGLEGQLSWIMNHGLLIMDYES